MLAGDTLVTISLAGSLFFSISPQAAESKVLLYLLLTVAPFAVVSPLLGPAIDANRRARRLIVCASAAGRVVLCILMAMSLHSLWLFPEAFCVLVLSKLYLVTRGALVPEMAAADQLESAEGVDDAGWPISDHDDDEEGAGHDLAEGFAGFNAQLTLLGTLAGFVISVPGIGLLKAFNAETVLVFASMVFVVAAACSLRLRIARVDRDDVEDRVDEATAAADRGPFQDREVILGLTASATVRLTAGFLTFLIAFGLRARPRGARLVRVRVRGLRGGGAPRPLLRRVGSVAGSPSSGCSPRRWRSPRRPRPSRPRSWRRSSPRSRSPASRPSRAPSRSRPSTRSPSVACPRAPRDGCSRGSPCASSSRGCVGRAHPRRDLDALRPSATPSSRSSPGPAFVGFLVGRASSPNARGALGAARRRRGGSPRRRRRARRARRSRHARCRSRRRGAAVPSRRP